LGVVLHRLEALVPLPSPWLKLGLANIPTLLAVVFLGMRAALTVAVLRVIVGSIFGGTFAGPTFFLGLAGGLAAAAAMALAYRLGSGLFSMVGVSVAGAYAHTAGIVACVYLFFARQDALWNLAPLFLLFSLATGILTGIAANTLVDRLARAGVTLK
jgi:heptaprenyl diphosphate synthase